jgi:hypothetical protein
MESLISFIAEHFDIPVLIIGIILSGAYYFWLHVWPFILKDLDEARGAESASLGPKDRTPQGVKVVTVADVLNYHEEKDAAVR